MTQCLGDDALYELHIGEGSEDARAHVESCDACSRRIKSLKDDLDLLTSVLSAPPPDRAPRPVRVWRPYPAVAMAAAAVLFLTFMAGRWSGNVAANPAQSASIDEEFAEVAAPVLSAASTEDPVLVASLDPLQTDNLDEPDDVEFTLDSDS